jgi:hypothetical protein
MLDKLFRPKMIERFRSGDDGSEAHLTMEVKPGFEAPKEAQGPSSPLN